MVCGELFSSSSVGSVPDKIKCRKCGVKLIGYSPYAYTKEAEKLVKKFVRGDKLSKEETKRLEMMHDSASIILTHGKDAIFTLAGRGIGVKTAARILRKGLKGKELLKEILEAEKQFARTKRFWKR